MDSQKDIKLLDIILKELQELNKKLYGTEE